MSAEPTRRLFSKTLIMAVPSLAAPRRTLKIGYAGLTWNAVPRTPENLETAVKDIASLGFWGFETFSEILVDWDLKGKLTQLIEENALPLKAGYCGTNLVDPALRKENLEKVIRWGKVIKKYGGTFGVLAPNGVKRDTYDFQTARPNIVASLNEYAMALNDLGLGAGLHQHTGTAIETRDEVYAVMDAVDTRHVTFAPDVGQLQKGGADAAKVVKDYLPLVRHMHLKDFSGGAHSSGYCPLGQGKVDLVGILDMLEAAGKNPDVIVELDRSSNAPWSALDSARIGKAFLEKLGYSFRS